MKKKNIVMNLFFVLMLVMSIVGCGSNENETEPEVYYADEDFVADMAKGLEARWTLNREDEEKEGYEDILVNSEEYQNMMNGYINAELEYVEKYKDEKFEDIKLQEIAIQYINCLKTHLEACSYMTVDYMKYEEEFTPVYNKRSQIIAQMVEEYGMTVGEEYQSTLNDFLTKALIVDEQEQTEKQVQEILAKITFEKNAEESSDDYFVFDAVVENTTETDFEYFDLDISLYDADEIVVDTPYCSVGTWKAGQKIKFTFSTQEKFEKYEINSAEWYEQ